MRDNVKNWKLAKAEGFDISLYRYESTDVPNGAVEAILLEKIWAKKVYTINCYFQSVRDGRRFSVTVYRRHEDHRYGPVGCATDFRTAPVPAIYSLMIAVEKEKVWRVHAEPVIL